jgi:hypothetical protein
MAHITVYCLTLQLRDPEIPYSNPSRGTSCALRKSHGFFLSLIILMSEFIPFENTCNFTFTLRVKRHLSVAVREPFIN